MRRFPLWESGGIVPGRLCVDLVGRVSKFRSYRRRRVDLFLAKSSVVVPGRRAVNFSPWNRLCVEFSPHKESSCKREVFLVLRFQGTGGKLYPSPWRALLHRSQGTARQQGNSKAAVLQRKQSGSISSCTHTFFFVEPGLTNVLLEPEVEETACVQLHPWACSIEPHKRFMSQRKLAFPVRIHKGCLLTASRAQNCWGDRAKPTVAKRNVKTAAVLPLNLLCICPVASAPRFKTSRNYFFSRGQTVFLIFVDVISVPNL
ncbi:hypothetical protein NDU88_004955 [Pleurodeles waltl]|uniref:Uncharacterized protein n=1 Tax=Pleurodeles waltl TaxID=8319 RepID=A0AAV7SKA6_PLEWA|nr:hypothetical protein NDU88_004955 [Pleurodeles waltl]